jgi:hypothetical protein
MHFTCLTYLASDLILLDLISMSITSKGTVLVREMLIERLFKAISIPLARPVLFLTVYLLDWLEFMLSCCLALSAMHYPLGNLLPECSKGLPVTSTFIPTLCTKKPIRRQLLRGPPSITRSPRRDSSPTDKPLLCLWG